MTKQAKAYANTDRELWREPDTTGNVDFYSPSIHVTERGGIGINCGGTVVVMPLRQWHALAVAGDEALKSWEVDDLVRSLEGWKEPENMSDDRARQFWLMKQAAKKLRALATTTPSPTPQAP